MMQEWVPKTPTGFKFSIFLSGSVTLLKLGAQSDLLLQLHTRFSFANMYIGITYWLILTTCQQVYGYFMLEVRNDSHCMLDIYTFVICFLNVFFLNFCSRSHQIRVIFQQIYLTHRCGSSEYWNTGSEWTWE